MKMKKFLLIICALISINVFAQSEVADSSVVSDADNVAIASDNSALGTAVTAQASQFDAANNAYISGQYPMAVALYEAILSKNLHSAKLYYNLGNAYFQQGQIGKAILNFTRASNIDPNDEDILYNMELAKAKTKDKIDVVPQFFLLRWFSSLGDIANSNTWAIFAIFFFAITALGTVAWLVAPRMRLRKVGFFTGFFAAIFTICSISFSVSAAQKQYQSEVAVVINIAAPIKSSPSAGGKDLFVLHEGTVVKVLQNLDNYVEIELSDGNKGWIMESAIEKV